MTYTKTNWVANVTPVTAVSMNNIENGIASLSASAPSTTPPASPADGDLWYLPVPGGGAVPPDGVIWQFRFNAGLAANKWQFIGGGPLLLETGTGQAMPNGAWANSTLSFTPARAGYYAFRCNARFTNAVGAVVDGVCGHEGVGIWGRTAVPASPGEGSCACAFWAAATAGTPFYMRLYANAAGLTAAQQEFEITPLSVS